MSWCGQITELRSMSGLGPREFGERLGTTRQTAHTWETEAREPLIHTALQVAQRAGLRVDDLIHGPLAWDREWHQTPPVGRDGTMWRANIAALAAAAGSVRALSIDLLQTQSATQSWVARWSQPTLRTAIEVSASIGVTVHEMLTTRVDAVAAVAKMRGRDTLACHA